MTAHRGPKGHRGRKRLAAPGDATYDAVSAILERHDPMHLLVIPPTMDGESAAEAYDPEASTIAPRLASVTSRDGVLRVVQEEFAHWFDDEPVPPLDAAADEMWAFLRPPTRGDGP